MNKSNVLISFLFKQVGFTNAGKIEAIDVNFYNDYGSMCDGKGNFLTNFTMKNMENGTHFKILGFLLKSITFLLKSM